MTACRASPSWRKPYILWALSTQKTGHTIADNYKLIKREDSWPHKAGVMFSYEIFVVLYNYRNNVVAKPVISIIVCGHKVFCAGRFVNIMDKPKTQVMQTCRGIYLKAYQMLPESHILRAAVKTERMVNKEVSFPFPSDKDLTQILVARYVGLNSIINATDSGICGIRQYNQCYRQLQLVGKYGTGTKIIELSRAS